MSYILGALQQAEKEKQRGTSPDIDRLIASDPGFSRGTRKPLRAQLAGGLLLAVVTGLAVGWLALAPREGPKTGSGLENGAASPAQRATAETSAAFDASEPVQVAEPERLLPGISAESTNQAPRPARNLVDSEGRPDLSVEGAMLFPSEPAKSRAFIGGQSYRVGDQIEPGIVLERISESQIWVSHQGDSYAFPY